MAQEGFTAFEGPIADQAGFLPISFEMMGQRGILRGLALWAADLDDLSAAWTQVGERILLPDFARQFEDEGGWLGARVGPPWAPLKPATLAEKERQGYGDRGTLVRTGQLERSVIERGAPGNIFLATATSLTVGTADPIAAFHQWGTRQSAHPARRQPHKDRTRVVYRTGKGGVPPRKMIGLRWESRGEIVRVLNEYVREKAIEAGIRVGH